MATINRIDTRRFYNSHLRYPKGWGMWLFEDKMGGVQVEHTGLYSEAKKVAQRFASENNTFLYVSP